MKYYFNQFYHWLVIMISLIILQVLVAAHYDNASTVSYRSARGSGPVRTQHHNQKCLDIEKDPALLFSAGKNTPGIQAPDENWLNTKSIIKVIL
jgi:hypothetical protein